MGNNLIEIRAKMEVELREICSRKQRSERGKLDVWRKEGRKEGRKGGREGGRKEGREEGRKEGEMQSKELWRGRLPGDLATVPTFQGAPGASSELYLQTLF